MLARYRLALLFVIALAASIIFVATGLPRTQLSKVLAQPVVEYDYDHGEHHAKNGPGQTCDGTDISDARQGTVVANTAIFWEPKEGSTIGSLGVTTGQSFWILEESDGWAHIVIACEKVWIPASAIQ